MGNASNVIASAVPGSPVVIGQLQFDFHPETTPTSIVIHPADGVSDVIFKPIDTKAFKVNSGFDVSCLYVKGATLASACDVVFGGTPASPSSLLSFTVNAADLALKAGGNAQFHVFDSGNVWCLASPGNTAVIGDYNTPWGITAASINDPNSNPVLKVRQAAVADPTGGSVIDVECRAQLSALLARLRAATGHGLIA